MKTDQPDAADAIAAAGAALRAGRLVVFPTETVYGVAANAADPEATARLRQAKGERRQQPFTVHIAGPNDASDFAPDAPVTMRRLARRAWPGPLTMVCAVASPEASPAGTRLPESQRREIYCEGKIGLRCPNHPVAERFLRAAAVPVVASSANRSGQRPPSDVSDALRGLGDAVEIALDGGPARYGQASTVIEIHDEDFRVLRAGALDERTLRRLGRSEVLMVCTGNTCRSPLAEYLFRAELARLVGVDPEQLGRLGYAVSSAGTTAFAGSAMSAGSAAELQRRGHDPRAHRSQPLTPELVQRAARVYTMTAEHRAALLAMAPALADRVQPLDPQGSIADPIGGGPQDYERCASQIEAAVRIRAKEFVDEDRAWQ